MLSDWFSSPTTKWFKQRNSYPLDKLPDELKSLLVFPELTPTTNLTALDILVVDFETSGFDFNRDQILSMGWVVIERGVIRLNSARHVLIKNSVHPDVVGAEAVKIHQLLPETLDKKGIPLESAFRQLFSVMSGKLVLAHGTIMEKRFFNQYIQNCYQLAPLPVPWLDTLRIEKARYKLLKHTSREQDWRLGPTRHRYGLPSYAAHNALVDAIATAELYLAQINMIFGHDDADVQMLLNFTAKS